MMKSLIKKKFKNNKMKKLIKKNKLKKENILLQKKNIQQNKKS